MLLYSCIGYYASVTVARSGEDIKTWKIFYTVNQRSPKPLN